MKTRIRHIALAAMLSLLAGPAAAACFADYRAGETGGSGLHYGVIELPDAACSMEAAGPEIARRIAAGGWQLLEVISVFDESGLDARRSDAGAYFLRF
ncbi:MAG: hypothetical protein HLUCCO18_15605 [Rhodobacteraceae bacterium HLUCCO18]|nr:MAG: hypothetical protein HLUCCO18_15605 [Rhodobacteraceae bacterium HLUCCO18]